MQGSSRTYEYSGETTEWEDILISKGIATREGALISRGLNPDDFIEKDDEDDVEEESRAELLEKATLEEIDAMQENDEFDDTRMLNEYRERRMRELKETAFKNKFGDIREIGKDQWISEVTEASRAVWVMVHLYQDSVLECRLMEEVLMRLALKFKSVKILKIKSTHAVENWPDRNLPTVFAYHEGVLKHQIMTLKQLGGHSMTADDVEWWMAEHGIVTTELEENPQVNKKKVVSVFSGGRRPARVADSDDDFDSDS